ncbi:hypothetical protein [Streptomyces sp. NPDC056721]|uniref:hypothetical protein n=1 Tax=unclassified Streptomyces TaxID=2593676 RepID=UPI0036847E69
MLDDSMSLVATFAGRMYGLRSREARRRLLAEAEDRMDNPAPGAGVAGKRRG